jgi:hypothetical protein
MKAVGVEGEKVVRMKAGGRETIKRAGGWPSQRGHVEKQHDDAIACL